MKNVSEKISKLLKFDSIYAGKPYNQIWFKVAKVMDSCGRQIDENIVTKINIEIKNKLKHEEY